MKEERFAVTGMTCAACQANVEKCVRRLPGVEAAEVSLLANRMTVRYDNSALTPESIEAAVSSIGYGASAESKRREENRGGYREAWTQRERAAEAEALGMKRRLRSSVAILVPLMYVAMGHMLSLPLPSILKGDNNALVSAFTQLLLTIPVLYLNRAFFSRGFKALYKRAPNMDSLVAIGSAAAFIYGVFAMYLMMYALGHGNGAVVSHYSHQLYFESSAMILTLVTVGKYLESRSKSRTTDALSKLVELAPKTARVIRDGAERVVAAEELRVGDTVVIRPGESLPCDGVVTEGIGFIDQSAITGESIPVEKNPGDEVTGATVNKNGSFRFTASKVGDDTTLARIIALVDEAGTSKAPIARLADKVAGVFVPTVIIIALFTAVIWLIAGQSFEFALSCAISVLVISCPCALGLATPVAIMAGTGKAAEYGILIKSAEALENLHDVTAVVLDKTGTITSGHPQVTDVLPLDNKFDERSFLAAAASLEAGSEHPLAEAVLSRSRELGLPLSPAVDFRSHAGRGVSAELGSEQWLSGNAAFLSERGVETAGIASTIEALSSEGKTPLIFARSGAVAGVIAVADTIKSTSREAVFAMRELGLRVVMLTGDNPLAARFIAGQLGLEAGDVTAGVLPGDKEREIRALIEQGYKVLMVGDGINDAPALKRADVGMAIGAGTDVAIESADIVLMRDSLLDAVTAIRLSRAVMRNIRMNLFWAFFYNILGIPIAAGALFPTLGLRLSPMIGSAAMSLSSVCVVTNALRLRRFKDDKKGKNNDPAAVAAEEKGTETMKKTLHIEGMMCAHCQANVQKALAAVPGVTAVTVELEKKTAEVTFEGEIPCAVLTAAVTEAGYEVISCEKSL